MPSKPPVSTLKYFPSIQGNLPEVPKAKPANIYAVQRGMIMTIDRTGDYVVVRREWRV